MVPVVGIRATIRLVFFFSTGAYKLIVLYSVLRDEEMKKWEENKFIEALQPTVMVQSYMYTIRTEHKQFISK